MAELPDVQSLRARYEFPLTRVGVSGIKKIVHVRRPGHAQPYTLIPEIAAAVDLPARQRGSHMSRNVEAINETIELVAREPVGSLEEFAQVVTESLLKRHEYATMAEIAAEADYFLERRLPSGVKSMENYRLVARAVARRDGGLRRSIGVEVLGVNACPCAMEATREILGEGSPAVGPFITHNQRNKTFLLVDCDDGHGAGVEANDLIGICEDALSAPTFEYLKRGDEARLVIRAHENPRFVEDVVREMLAAVVRRYGDLPDDTVVTARSEAEESIHKHNAFAERVTTMRELRSNGPGSGA
ncbi:MAG TPA: GTP cyclohydrolase MptA [Candidatus Thermoplasmatota archaeon]|nr:GTP cyclohydrolase MptA [Candidatus Thermoplasmatota archaeon]